MVPFTTHQHSVISFVAFRLQFHHILDQYFCVTAKQGLDAIYKTMKKERKKKTQLILLFVVGD